MSRALSIRLPFLALDGAERTALANWLLVWVVLANVGFSLMYLTGSPPRATAILAFGAVGLVVRRQGHIVQCLAFVGALAYAVVGLLGALFNLPIFSLSRSIVFMAQLNTVSSVEYVLVGLFLVGLVIAACLALRRPTAFTDLRAFLVAAAAVGLLAACDVAMSHGTSGHYTRLASADAPFDSATTGSGFVPGAGEAKRHLVMVMVESLGAPAGNAELDRLIFARYDDPAVRARFAVSTGTTTYYGSTTSGEIRELCGRWGDYYDLVARADGTCLPARLARQGYEASAWHSFDGSFFARRDWYPNIGFEDLRFRDDLVKRGAETCGGVFPGACDRDVPRQLAAHLKAADKPQFLYWLTVNSHLPVPEANNLGVENCARVSAALAAEYPMICRQVAIWDAIDAALMREITAADFPPTDILVVGDHMPPYFDRKSRVQFAPDRVPWLLLKWRGD